MFPFTRHTTPQAWFVPPRACSTMGRSGVRRRRPWLALALLAGYLLFCHGCHGDEDNELFVRRRVVRARSVSEGLKMSLADATGSDKR